MNEGKRVSVFLCKASKTEGSVRVMFSSMSESDLEEINLHFLSNMFSSTLRLGGFAFILPAILV